MRGLPKKQTKIRLQNLLPIPVLVRLGFFAAGTFFLLALRAERTNANMFGAATLMRSLAGIKRTRLCKHLFSIPVLALVRLGFTGSLVRFLDLLLVAAGFVDTGASP